MKQSCVLTSKRVRPSRKLGRGARNSLRGGLLLAGLVSLAASPTAAGEIIPGRLILESRTRLESLDMGVQDAEALTSRLRLGWTAPLSSSLSGLVEVEAVGVLDNAYGDGVRPARGKAVIPDPEIFELNRAQLAWTIRPGAEVTAGRQRIVLGNARFIGSVGWRQNEQTFDGVRVDLKARDGRAVTYAYVAQVNRTIGRDHPQGEWRGDLHLLNADAPLPHGMKLGSYLYLLDFDFPADQSTATVGARLTGETKLFGKSAGWEVEYARQSDFGAVRDNFALDYVLVGGDLKGPRGSVGLVFEQLGGDGRHGFQTPLATLHGFQGRSDVIGATPAVGLRDVYVRAAFRPAARPTLKLAGELHEFRDGDWDRRFGHELDISLQAPINPKTGIEIGLARFSTDSTTYPDAVRAWLSVEYRH